MKTWYEIDSIGQLDSPTLVVYLDRVKENIKVLLSYTTDPSRLRPHVKTNKSGEISKLLLDAGIHKFKCATIAEAEMLAIAGAPDVLLAYQPVGPKAVRLLALQQKYPATQFSCLIDTPAVAEQLDALFRPGGRPLPVYIDLNVGMNRTGIVPVDAYSLVMECKQWTGIRVAGLHAYDGHIRDSDLALRTKNCNASFAAVEDLRKKIDAHSPQPITLIAGGTPTFPIHVKRKDVEASPGTFIYWDQGYQVLLPDEPFVVAALVVSRVISKPTGDTLCTDLGHKAIASENSIDKRVHFLNAPDLQATGHSEEHLVVKTPGPNSYQTGDVLYGVPYHICPTVALHDTVTIVEQNKVVGKWSTVARNRGISV